MTDRPLQERVERVVEPKPTDFRSPEIGEERYTKLGNLLESEKVTQAIVDQVASVSHEAWKRDHFKLRGEGAPRWKPTLDTEWVAEMRPRLGTDQAPWLRESPAGIEINIAAMDYRQLPTDWRGENLATSLIVMEELRRTITEREAMDAVFIAKTAHAVHQAWLERNGKWAEPIQKLSFEDLLAVAKGLVDPAQKDVARGNMVMDINYVVEGIKALLYQETLEHLGI